MERGGPAVSLASVPDACILTALLFLDVRDALRFRRTCRRMNQLLKQSQNDYWLPLLRRDFGLHLQAVESGTTLFKLYRTLFAAVPALKQRQASVRYVGVFTDGGVDNALHQHRIDNMFSPNSWESYHSEGASNINAIGLLVADLHKTADREQAAYRSTLLQWLSPAMVSSYYSECDPVREGLTWMTPEFIEQGLKATPTRTLERRLEDFYDGLLQGDPDGMLLLPYGLSEEDLQKKRQQLERVVSRVRASRQTTRKVSVVSPPGRPRVQLMRPAAAELVAKAPGKSKIGVFHEIVVSRKGLHSSPVATGVIFAVNVGVRGNPGAALDAYCQDLLVSMQGLAGHSASKAFNDLKNKSDVLAACRSGALPQPVACSACDAGVWIEFEPTWPAPSAASTNAPMQAGAPRPVAWFHFFDETECWNWCAWRGPAGYRRTEAVPQDIWAEDGPWAHEPCPAAAPPSAAYGDATGAAPGPSTGGQLRQEFAWMGEPLYDPWAYHSSKCPLTHEAQALELFNRALARATAACEADKPAAMAHALLFAGCSRLAAEAMESGAAAGPLPPQGLENVSTGLRLAEPIVVGLAQSHVAPRMAVEVLALWVRKAAGGGPAGAKSVFSERPDLEEALYSADMRAGLRAAPPAASSVFRRAMASMRDYMRAEPGDVVLEDRKALRACLRAERRADNAADERHPRPEYATAAAVREAKSQFEAAASLVPAALAARGRGAMAAPPPQPASSDDVSEGSFGAMPHDSGEGSELDGMESDKSDHSLRLEEEDARMHDDGPLFITTTRGRDMLTMRLLHVRACNAVLVKLVDQELTAEYIDEREYPNIFVRHVTFHGSHIALPNSVALSC